MADMRFIRARYRAASNAGHFFDAASMRFFSSRISTVAYGARNSDGTPFDPTPKYRNEASVYFFVTSEQDRSPYTAQEDRAWCGERRYSIRRMTFTPDSRADHWETVDITTVDSDYGAYADSRTANVAAKRLASNYAESLSE